MSATIYTKSWKMYTMVDNYFVEWLEKEMTERNLSQSELARRSGVTRSAINGVLTGYSNPGPELCEAIARAFKIAPEIVFRKAGILPPKPSKDNLTEEAEFLLSQLTESQRKQAVKFIRFLAEEKGGYNASDPMAEDG